MIFSNKKHNFAFTLIELLAVIVILGVIALITTPIILGIIEDAKKSSFKDTAYGLIDGAKYYAVKNIVNKEKIFTITDSQFVGDSIDMQGALPDNGHIMISSDNKVSVKVTNTNWCAYKEYDDEGITITDDLEACYLYIEEPIPDIPVTNAACFAFNSTTGTITDYYDYESNNSANPTCPKEVNIPESISGKGVYTIGNNAFQSNQLIKVIIPGTVFSIGDSAFKSNQLTNVYIKNGVESISAYAFQSNQLTSMVIPSSVVSISSSAFSQTTPISTVIIKYNEAAIKTRFDSSLSSIGWGSATVHYVYEEPIVTSANCFSFASSTGAITFYQYNENSNSNNRACPKAVVIPSSINGVAVRIIDSKAFEARYLKGLKIPDSITSIGNYAFNENVLTSITVPNSVIDIGWYAFSNNQLKIIVIPNSVKSIYDYAFDHNQLTSVTIPNSVTYIGSQAFGNNQLTSITIPNSVTRIYNSVFTNNQLTSVTIPNSVTSIGDSAFNNNQLTSVIIPNGITNIGSAAFSANQLTSIIFPNSVESISTNAFQGNQLTGITIPSSVISISNGAFSQTTPISNVAIKYNEAAIKTRFDSNLSGIGWVSANITYAYEEPIVTSANCFNFDSSTGTITFYQYYENSGSNNRACPKAVVIPSSINGVAVRIIGNKAFETMYLKGLKIPNSVTSIGNYAFNDNALTSITVPNSVIDIGWWAFSNNQLKIIVIPNSVKSIYDYAFQNNQLTSVTIPNSVTYIGSSAFSQTSSYPWGTVTINGNITNPATRFDSSLTDIGWGSATTINRVTE